MLITAERVLRYGSEAMVVQRMKLQPRAGRLRAPAFTLLELLVVLAVLGLLGSMLLPTLAKSGVNSKGFQCQNNHRQLCNAWRMYADDNRDRIVYASVGGTFNNPLNQYAWTGSVLDFNPNNRYNWDTNADIVVRPLWPYTGRNASIYKCPSDQSGIIINAVFRPIVLTMSMNLYLGGFAGDSGGVPALAAQTIFLKTTELNAPGPAKTFVFIDARSDMTGWGNFFTDMTGYPNNPVQDQFQDMPGMLHDSAAGFCFGDGHTELHRWVDARTTPPLGSFVTLPIVSPRNPDIAWLQDHATRPR